MIIRAFGIAAAAIAFAAAPAAMAQGTSRYVTPGQSSCLSVEAIQKQYSAEVTWYNDCEHEISITITKTSDYDSRTYTRTVRAKRNGAKGTYSEALSGQNERIESWSEVL